MSWILRVDNLSKVYRIGAGASHHGTLYEQCAKKIKKFIPGNKLAKHDGLIEEENEGVVVSGAQSEGLQDGYFWALKNISFQIKPGERIGLIGRNGSGKSTLLKILSRITAPTHGEFRYRGNLISLLEVGTGFHPELTGRENLFLNAAINGMSRQQINQRFKEIVEFSEVGRQIDTPVKKYSSGMYMRLAFSVAAFLESEILLIDEVLAVGDQSFQEKCKEKMLALANDGRSVIFVNHDMSAIESICKKTIEMSYGQIVEIKDVVIPKEKEGSQLIGLVEFPHPFKEIKKSRQEYIFDVSEFKNDALQLVSAAILSQDGVLQDKYSVNEEVNIKINFKIFKPETKLNIRVDLTTDEGVIVFSSIDHHIINSDLYSRLIGCYHETLIIPKEFLNQGQFFISIHFIRPSDSHYILSSLNCLSLNVYDDFLPIGVRSTWSFSWPNALLRPNLVWKMWYDKKVSDKDLISYLEPSQ